MKDDSETEQERYYRRANEAMDKEEHLKAGARQITGSILGCFAAIIILPILFLVLYGLLHG